MDLFNSFLTNATSGIRVFCSNYYISLFLFIPFIIATYTDLKNQKVYDKFNIAFLMSRLVFVGMLPQYGGMPIKMGNIIGALTGALILLIPAMIKMHKMGGDIKFSFVLGLFLGDYFILILMIIACILNLIYFIFMVKVKKDRSNKPFVPFLFMAYLIIFVSTLIF